eukprot:403376724
MTQSQQRLQNLPNEAFKISGIFLKKSNVTIICPIVNHVNSAVFRKDSSTRNKKQIIYQ